MSEYFFTKNGDTYDIFEKKEGQMLVRLANLDVGHGALLWDREQWDGLLEVIGEIAQHAVDRQGRLNNEDPEGIFTIESDTRTDPKEG